MFRAGLKEDSARLLKPIHAWILEYRLGDTRCFIFTKGNITQSRNHVVSVSSPDRIIPLRQ
jgi:hypothetical protein